MADLSDIAYKLKDNASQYLETADDIIFLGKCISHFDRTKSQNFQDVFAYHVSPSNHTGRYVEFGATNGIDGSNTYMLNRYYNWTGILAEPNPIWKEQLIQNRSSDNICFDCVWTESGKTLEFLATAEPDLSTIEGFGLSDEHSEQRRKHNLISVNTTSLTDLLESYSPFTIPEGSYYWDYLSIDTEGSEFDILDQFFKDKSGHRFGCITVEHNYQEKTRDKILSLLTKHGYIRKYTYMSRWDDFYVLKG